MSYQYRLILTGWLYAVGGTLQNCQLFYLYEGNFVGDVVVFAGHTQRVFSSEGRNVWLRA